MARRKHKIATVDITPEFGARIKAFRENHGYTREQLCERSGVSVRYITAIENEGSIPTVEVLNDLLHALGMSSDILFFPAPNKEGSELDQLSRLFLVCDKRERRIVIDLINSLIDSREPE